MKGLVNTPKYEAPILIVKLEKGMDKPIYHKWGLNQFTIVALSLEEWYKLLFFTAITPRRLWRAATGLSEGKIVMQPEVQRSESRKV